jgi:hypothetical protein
VQRERQVAFGAAPDGPAAVAGDGGGVAQTVDNDPRPPALVNEAPAGIQQCRAENGARSPHVHDANCRPLRRRPRGKLPYRFLPPPRGGVEAQGGRRGEADDRRTLRAAPGDGDVPGVDGDALVPWFGAVGLVVLLHDAEHPGAGQRQQDRGPGADDHVRLPVAGRLEDRGPVPPEPAVVRSDRVAGRQGSA